MNRLSALLRVSPLCQFLSEPTVVSVRSLPILKTRFRHELAHLTLHGFDVATGKQLCQRPPLLRGFWMQGKGDPPDLHRVVFL